MLNRFILLFTFTFSCLANAAVDVNATVEFSKSINAYFSTLLGPNAVRAEEYPGGVPEPERLRFKNGSDVVGRILHSIAFLELSNDLICRIGIGFAHAQPGVYSDNPRTAVFAECVPLVTNLGAPMTLAKKYDASLEHTLYSLMNTDEVLRGAKRDFAATVDPTLILDDGFELGERYVRTERLYYYGDSLDQNLQPKFSLNATVQFEFGVKRNINHQFAIWETSLKSCGGDLTAKSEPQELSSRRL